MQKHQDKESYMNNYEKSTDVLYGVVDMDLTDTTFASIGASVEDIDRSGIRWGECLLFIAMEQKQHLIIQKQFLMIGQLGI